MAMTPAMLLTIASLFILSTEETLWWW